MTTTASKEKSRSADRAVTGGAPAVDVRGVTFAYPRSLLKGVFGRGDSEARRALDGITLHIDAGASVAVLGPNGSGKSTLLKILATLLQPDSGTVAVFGAEDRPSIRQALGVVFQSPGLDRQMTVQENLADSARLYGLSSGDANDAIDATLKQVGLTDRRSDRVKSLSGGLARRADLCRALLHKPKLLLLDEPTTGLDPTARSSFLDLVEQRRQTTNLTVLMTTHLTEEAQQFDRVVLMHEGRIVADDAPADLQREAGAARLTVHDPGWQPPGDASDDWKRTGDGWRMTVSDGPEDLRRRAAQLAEQQVPFTLAPPTLDDVFEQLTGATLSEQTT